MDANTAKNLGINQDMIEKKIANLARYTDIMQAEIAYGNMAGADRCLDRARECIEALAAILGVEA